MLKAREYGMDLDAAIVEALRAQCMGAEIPEGLTFRKENIGRFLPLNRLAEARIAYCGAFTLRDGQWAIAPEFRPLYKPPR